MKSSRTLVQSACFVACLMSAASYALAADDAGSGPKLRILSSRPSNSQSSSDSVQFEAARSQVDQPPPAPAPTPSVKGKPSPRGPSASAPGRSSSPTSLSAGPAPASAPTTANTSPARLRALQRVSAMNQANSMPVQAGVPYNKSAKSEKPTSPKAAVDSDSPPHTRVAAAPAEAASAVKEDPMYPVSTGPLVSRNPLASEVVREGSSYYFFGSINGATVKFRINESVFGIMVPTSLASDLKLIDSATQSAVRRLGEVIAPVKTIAFGPYPVNSAMVKVYNGGDDDVIDIGADALSNFKIKDRNGRLMLTKA